MKDFQIRKVDGYARPATLAGYPTRQEGDSGEVVRELQRYGSIAL